MLSADGAHTVLILPAEQPLPILGAGIPLRLALGKLEVLLGHPREHDDWGTVRLLAEATVAIVCSFLLQQRI